MNAWMIIIGICSVIRTVHLLGRIAYNLARALDTRRRIRERRCDDEEDEEQFYERRTIGFKSNLITCEKK